MQCQWSSEEGVVSPETGVGSRHVGAEPEPWFSARATGALKNVGITKYAVIAIFFLKIYLFI